MKKQNPLISIPLGCLSEGKAITGHVQVYSLDRYSNCECLLTDGNGVNANSESALMILQYLLWESWLLLAVQQHWLLECVVLEM